jgi:antitoxin YefM
MRAVTVEDAAQNLDGLVTRVTDDSEPAILIAASGRQVVMVPLDDYNAWRETHYLLASPANAAHVRRSMLEAQAGHSQERELAEPSGE